MLAAEKEAEEAVAEKGGGQAGARTVSLSPAFPVSCRAGVERELAPLPRSAAEPVQPRAGPPRCRARGRGAATPVRARGAEAGTAPVRAAEIAVRLGMLEQVPDPLETLRYPTG